MTKTEREMKTTYHPAVNQTLTLQYCPGGLVGGDYIRMSVTPLGASMADQTTDIQLTKGQAVDLAQSLWRLVVDQSVGLVEEAAE